MLQNRRFERVQLPDPVDATAGTICVVLVDVSPTGFKVHHQEQLPPKGEPFALHFAWNGEWIRVQCVTAWTTIHRFARSTSERPTLSSGLRIERADADSERSLAAMITSLTASPYLFCELVGGAWKQSRTSRRDQPGEGFTLSAAEDTAQIEKLCTAYASGDGETRKLIRTLAALSIKSRADSTAGA
jgi:hypothetical protein